MRRRNSGVELAQKVRTVKLVGDCGNDANNQGTSKENLHA